SARKETQWHSIISAKNSRTASMCKRHKVDANKASHLAFLERGAAWYPSLYAPRAGGAHDSHHWTAGIAGRTRRRGSGVAARGAGAATRDASDWVPQQRIA